MKILVVDTSTSIGFDEVKHQIIQDVNTILDGDIGLVYFFNTRVDSHHRCFRISEKDFDMRGSSSIWDSLDDILERHKKDTSIDLYILTDGKDTSSVFKTYDDIEYELWFLKLTSWWSIHWVYWKPLKRSCSLFT